MCKYFSHFHLLFGGILKIEVIFNKYLETQKISWENSKFQNRLLFKKTSSNHCQKHSQTDPMFPLTILAMSNNSCIYQIPIPLVKLWLGSRISGEGAYPILCCRSRCRWVGEGGNWKKSSSFSVGIHAGFQFHYILNWSRQG